MPAYENDNDNDNDDSSGDDSQKPRSKRLKRLGSNPLADARKNSKQQTKADQLWHRKSGAGYQLFVQYYSHQTIGCVVAEGKSQQPPVVQRTTCKQGGMSRAAKKRKKKKAASGLSQGNPQMNINEDVSITKDDTNQLGTTEQYEVLDSKLIKALNEAPPFVRLLPGYNNLKTYLEYLSKPLPLTFRLREGTPTNVMEVIKEDLRINYGHLVQPCVFESTIYKSNSCFLSKASLSKVSPSLKNLLVRHSADGTLARQELGSMLPVYGLARANYLKTNSRVLDICASPGSKALQALEIVGIHGRVVANDVHPTRLDTLKDAVQRSGLPSDLLARMLYTNFDAGVFPTPKKLFDAVLCDVPCSGDGTIRKDKHVLPLWTPATGNTLHSLQIRILLRALQLVRIGGVVSYSTCSLNPVEDEAVVAHVLTKLNNATSATPAVELVEYPTLLGFESRPGIQEWNVADYEGEGDDEYIRLRWHATYKDATNANMEKAVPSMWAHDVSHLHLERCLRLWPQDHDAGGFFVALLRRNH